MVYICKVCSDKFGKICAECRGKIESELAPRSDDRLAGSSAVIPKEVLDLVRFMCASWTDIDKWAHENMEGDALLKYPVIQGTSNQLKLKQIGEQKHDIKKIRKAVEWLLEQSV